MQEGMLVQKIYPYLLLQVQEVQGVLTLRHLIASSRKQSLRVALLVLWVQLD